MERLIADHTLLSTKAVHSCDHHYQSRHCTKKLFYIFILMKATILGFINILRDRKSNAKLAKNARIDTKQLVAIVLSLRLCNAQTTQ